MIQGKVTPALILKSQLRLVGAGQKEEAVAFHLWDLISSMCGNKPFLLECNYVVVFCHHNMAPIL